jgi:hypothetical protein
VLDWKETLSHIKNIIRESQRTALSKDFESKEVGWYVKGLYNPNNTNTSPASEIDELAILKKAANDPNPFIKHYATGKLKEFEQEQHK